VRRNSSLLAKRFAHLQHGPTEIWGDNASCILMSENPSNRERSRHVDARVPFLLDMVRDGSVKLTNAQVCKTSLMPLLRVCLDLHFTSTESS